MCEEPAGDAGPAQLRSEIAGFADIMDTNVAFRVPGFMATQFNQIHAVHNAFLAEFGLDFLHASSWQAGTFSLFAGTCIPERRRNRPCQTAVAWVDAAERDRRLDLVDAILGDDTPRS